MVLDARIGSDVAAGVNKVRCSDIHAFAVDLQLGLRRREDGLFDPLSDRCWASAGQSELADDEHRAAAACDEKSDVPRDVVAEPQRMQEPQDCSDSGATDCLRDCVGAERELLTVGCAADQLRDFPSCCEVFDDFDVVVVVHVGTDSREEFCRCARVVASVAAVVTSDICSPPCQGR